MDTAHRKLKVGRERGRHYRFLSKQKSHFYARPQNGVKLFEISDYNSEVRRSREQ